MKDTILGEIYLSLNKEELKGLYKYIKNSIWNQSDTIVKCHEYFYLNTLDNKLESTDKAELFIYIYPNDSYNDSKLRFVLNRTMKAIKEYIVLEDLKKENVFTQKIWMDFLIDKKLRKNIQYNINENEPIENSDYRFLYQFFKSQEISVYNFNYQKDITQRFNSIIKIMDCAQDFSDIIFLRNYCSLISFSETYKSIPIALPIDRLEEIKIRTSKKKIPEFEVYLALVDMLINKNEKEYFIYKEILFTNLDSWSNIDTNALITYLLNHTTKQINSGKSEYINEQYELYKQFETLNIFELIGFLNHSHINNVIHIYLRNNDIARADNFLTKYVDLLTNELKETCFHFNTARIQYEKKLYKESLRELLKVDFSLDTFYTLNSKILMMKNYFELNEFDAFDSLCISFKEYIRKNKIISDIYKVSYIGFIKTLRKIFASNKSSLKKLKLQLEKNQKMVEKQWLISKIEVKINSI